MNFLLITLRVGIWFLMTYLGSDMKSALIIPTLNEIVGMRKIIPLIRKEWVDEIIIVDLIIIRII